MVATALAGLGGGAAQAQTALRPDQVEFRALYKQLVETDSSITTGSCTVLADKVEHHLRAAGYGDADITRFAVPDHPAEGGLVVILPGTSKVLRPILLLGHLDVVVARRQDWVRDPYTLIEEDGKFYGRGASDMKAMDAIWIDLMSRLKRDGTQLKRTLKLALTCGEETSTAFNGAQWLAEHRRDLIDAEFALNEGGGGRTDGKGKVLTETLHVGEKTPVNYRIEATNAGGHSSIPIRDNAIYELADALGKLRNWEFPLQMTDTTRAFFAKAGAARGDDLGRAMVTLATATPGSAEFVAAEALVNTDRSYHAMLRTTCVATLLDGGHANNALPQRAGANINCRIFPGVSGEAVRLALQTVIADTRMTVVRTDNRGPDAVPPPLDPKVLGPAEKLVAKYYPGVPLVPAMSAGATDGVYLEAVGIPSYGPPGTYSNPDGNGAHGLNEYAIVKAVYTGRDLLNELVREYASH
ncbi:M20/M25/M40 family metallo-hydrolase [Novosphingobium sp.]|uniref:M20/M25/M40 family metallo-hydrolase n=1 Tax=Novosphingobium sp. TaxID=1874826 RepID=UPI0033406F8C